MTKKEEVEQSLQRLLKSRQIPADDEQLKNIRTSLLKRLPIEASESTPGIFSYYRIAASFAVLFLIIGLLLWTVDPLHRSDPPSSAFSTLMTVAADDEQLDHALVLLSGFASNTDQGKSAVAWDAYSRTLLSDNRGESLLETFYAYEPS